MPTNELIISCYNNAKHLKVVLDSVLRQQVLPDAICFSDDGSAPDTVQFIRSFIASSPIPARHIWQEDRGFRKSRALNKAIQSSDADYLIFIDGDCILHPGFVQRHLGAAAPRQFLTGSVIRLCSQESALLLDAGQANWGASGLLTGWTPRGVSKRLKAGILPLWLSAMLERLSPVRKTWAGGHASAFRADILRVNGFDETMGYGSEDKEFGTRLSNVGVKGRHVRYSAPLYHLEHARGYVDQEVYAGNREKLRHARRNKTIWSEFGIQQ